MVEGNFKLGCYPYIEFARNSKGNRNLKSILARESLSALKSSSETVTIFLKEFFQHV